MVQKINTGTSESTTQITEKTTWDDMRDSYNSCPFEIFSKCAKCGSETIEDNDHIYPDEEPSILCVTCGDYNASTVDTHEDCDEKWEMTPLEYSKTKFFKNAELCGVKE